MSPLLYDGAMLLLDPSDHTLLTSTPYTHGLPFSRCSTTNDGPRPQLSLPSLPLLCVGAWAIAPDAPDPFAGLGRRKERAELQVADAAGARVAGAERRQPDRPAGSCA